MPDPSALPKAKKAKLPQSPSPELATLVDRVPEGDEWLHELKLDGYRILVRVEDGDVRCLTRRGKDWTDRMRGLAEAAAGLPTSAAVIDGEACALRRDGKTDFQLLQNSLSEGGARPIVYFAFDLIHLDGYDLTDAPLIERKRLLRALLDGVEEGPLRYSDHVQGSGAEFYEQACRKGLEGIICKRAGAKYSPRRTKNWLKVKCTKRQELVIGGFTEPGGSRSYLGALLVGAHDAAGRLVYRGKVGTGFTEKALADLYGRLIRLERKSSPFFDPPKGAAARGIHWVTPELLAEIEYTEVTNEGLLRHPRFKGLRQDKPAERVTMDEPTTSPRHGDSKLESVPVRLTNPDRILYEEQGTTKRQLASYYAQVADWMLPYVKDRILTLVRCPEGRHKECFYQKHVTRGLPEHIHSVAIEEKNKTVDYMSIDDVLGLVSLVQIGTLEVHAWGAHRDRPERPDELVFDLDPGEGVGFEEVIEGASTVRSFLGELGLECFVKTTGGKGLHVVLPVERRLDWDTTKAFCKAVAERISRRDPERYLATMSKAKRRGRVFIDYLRNGRGATSVCPFSTRARQGAPVATPLAWDELSTNLSPDAYDIQSVPRRLASLKRDPWGDYFDTRQSITKKMREAVGMK